MKFTDTHAHLYTNDFSEDIEQVVQRAIENGVTKVVTPSTKISNHTAARDLAHRFPNNIFPSYGLHPTEIDANTDLDAELKSVESIINDPSSKACAVGEIGLDLYWSQEFVEQQKIALHYQIELALKCNLPIIIHCRDAYEMMFEELERYRGELRGVFHSFSGSVEEYQYIKDLGDFYFGIGGVLTFKNSSLPEVVKQIDIERLILETDAPYLTPAPFRGKRNESGYIPIIAAKIAECKNISVEMVSEITERNSSKLFNI